MRGAHSLRLAAAGCQLDAEGFQIARLDGFAAAESLDDALALLGRDVAVLAGLGVVLHVEGWLGKGPMSASGILVMPSRKPLSRSLCDVNSSSTVGMSMGTLFLATVKRLLGKSLKGAGDFPSGVVGEDADADGGRLCGRHSAGDDRIEHPVSAAILRTEGLLDLVGEVIATVGECDEGALDGKLRWRACDAPEDVGF